MDINYFKSELENYHGGFFSIQGYTNSHNETSNYLINVKVDRSNLIEQDIEILESFTASSQLQEEARKSVLGGLISPQKSRSKGQTDAYETIAPNIKRHKGTGNIFITGQLVKKVVLVEGEYPTVNSAQLTIEKNKIKKLLKSTKYRQFCIGNEKNIDLVQRGAKAFTIVVKRK